MTQENLKQAIEKLKEIHDMIEHGIETNQQRFLKSALFVTKETLKELEAAGWK